MKRTLPALIGLLLVLAGTLSVAEAEIILANGVDPPYVTGGSGTLFDDPNTVKAVGLKMEGGVDYWFDSFRVVLENVSGNPQATGRIYVNDGSYTPGALLRSLDTMTVLSGSAASIYTFTSTTPLLLEDEARYWFAIASGPAAGSFRWNTNSPTAEPTGGPGTYLNYVLSNNGGAYNNSTVLCALEIDGTVVPEPAALVWLALGSLALACRNRR